MKDLTINPAAGDRGADRSLVLSTMARGRALLQPVAALFTEFLQVPAQAALDAALAMAKALSTAGLSVLTPEQRQRANAQISTAACTLAPDVAAAAERAPEVEVAAGVTGKALLRLIAQEEELLGLSRALEVLRRAVGDTRRQLQVWQHEAQQRVLGALLREFQAAPTLALRMALTGEAGPVLDAVEAQLQALRAARAEGAAASADAAAERAELDEDLLLVQTMRAVREGQPVDEELLRRVALRYAGKAPPTGGLDPAVRPAPEKDKPAARETQPKARAKAKPKPKPDPTVH